MKKITSVYELRKLLGWSQVRLSNELSVSQPLISVWEKSNRVSPLMTAKVEKLAAKHKIKLVLG
jgi:transcriptional regulator with XRE-family HTH domain